MELRNKIAGAVYGMALGDAMGMPPELWGRERTRKFFGSKIAEFLDGPAENDVSFNYKRAQFTDDTGQALVLIDSLDATDLNLPLRILHNDYWIGLTKRMLLKTIF